MKILLVDDDAELLSLTGFALQQAGFLVVKASDGLDAVEGCAPGSFAMQIKIHHCAIDGIAGIELMNALHDLEREGRGTIVDPWRGEPDPPALSLLALAAANAARVPQRALDVLTRSSDAQAVDAVLAPDAPTEPELRRAVQRQSLEALARLERTGGAGFTLEPPDEPRVHLTKLAHAPVVPAQSPRLRTARDKLADLTDKQRELLFALSDGEPVVAVAQRIEMSRSNIYASLRRISRRLGLSGTDELLALVRQGMLQERK